ncbi:gastrin-releasing peptide [Ornithorhynchus anatinus]|uniref:Gastrin-releasing peptide n=1 Tax=Ornithorhynchus anatinus TaxID=9258 RepID=K7E7N8_ORNAN|nr:gastrin-releasing peptide [Ornithorhynchus anatinus]
MRVGEVFPGKWRSLSPFILLTLVLFEAPRGAAAPVQPSKGNPLAKIYPRGSHWAVGHLMGKKSIGDFPSDFERESKIPLSTLPENLKQLSEYLRWEETAKNLLQLLEGNDDRNNQPLREEPPGSPRNTWALDNNNNFRDVVDYLLQVLNMKESTPS